MTDCNMNLNKIEKNLNEKYKIIKAKGEEYVWRSVGEKKSKV